MSKQRQWWWGGFTVPEDGPDELTFQSDMHAWQTGWGPDYSTWTCAVWALTEEEAQAKVDTVAEGLGPWIDWSPMGRHSMLGDRFGELRLEPLDCDECGGLLVHDRVANTLGFRHEEGCSLRAAPGPAIAPTGYSA